MTIIATSQRRNAHRPCRSSTGHSAACSDRQCRSQWKAFLPINAPLFDRDDLLSHRIGIDHCARSACRNSNTAPAALKSP